MQLLKNKFDAKRVEQFLIKENKFITDLFAVTAIPERKDFDEINDEENEYEPNSIFQIPGKKTRAKSLEELQQRLKNITGRKKLTYKEKLTKKVLKNRMKRKSKQDERNVKQKLARAAKLVAKNEIKSENNVENKSNLIPLFNSENNFVFSKVDFTTLDRKKNKQNDPKKILKVLEEQKEKIQKLEDSGETKKAIEIKEKTVWKNALAKAEGQKVKDDPALLKKSVQKKEQRKRLSKKKWENRIQGEQKAKEERQRKRKENIDKKKKDKKNKKLKTASKKGKIIPGF